jgi:shikimate dehydrogenase
MNKVGLIGWPVAHSLSPAMHNAAFKALGMDDWEYDTMAIPPDIAHMGLREPMRHGYIGVNVTVPHKQMAMKYVRPDELARAVGAVNTVRFADMLGTNTDVTGFIEDLKAYDVALEGMTALVLGAGGAARAAVYGLRREGASVIVVNRTRETAQRMLADLTISAGVRDVPVMTLDEAAEQSLDLIVNCTSAGMWPNVETTPWIEGVPFPEGITLYDMVYIPQKTTLMAQCEAAGGRAIGGLGMLVRQGAAAFEIFTGQEAPLGVMFAAAEVGLRQRMEA